MNLTTAILKDVQHQVFSITWFWGFGVQPNSFPLHVMFGDHYRVIFFVENESLKMIMGMTTGVYMNSERIKADTLLFFREELISLKIFYMYLVNPIYLWNFRIFSEFIFGENMSFLHMWICSLWFIRPATKLKVSLFIRSELQNWRCNFLWVESYRTRKTKGVTFYELRATDLKE